MGQNNKQKEERNYRFAGRNITKQQYDNYREYQNDFMKDTYKTYAIKFNRDKDKDVLEYLSTKDSVTGFIRQCIVEYMEKEKENKKED